MAEVVAFPGAEPLDGLGGPQPDADVIELLEKYLGLARTGHVTAVGLAVAQADGSVRECWAVGSRGDRHHLISAVMLLTHRMVSAVEASGVEVPDGGA